MLVARLQKSPSRRRLEGDIEKAVTLPAGTSFTLAKITDHEWHLIAVLPLKRLTAKQREASRECFEGQCDGD